MNLSVYVCMRVCVCVAFRSGALSPRRPRAANPQRSIRERRTGKCGQRSAADLPAPSRHDGVKVISELMFFPSGTVGFIHGANVDIAGL